MPELAAASLSRMHTVARSIRFPLRPTASQHRQMVRTAGARRFVWNWALERRLAHFRSRGKTLPSKQISLDLTALKRQPGYRWLYDIDSQALQQSLLDLHRAFESFFAGRSGFPRFKSRRSDPSRFRIPQRVRVDGQRVFIPKVGWVRARMSQPLPSQPGSLTVKQDAKGIWFATVVVSVRCDPPRDTLERAIGIDLGLHDLIVTSDGTRIPNPGWLRREERRLRRAHRSLSKRSRGSRNRDKARKRLAVRYRRIAHRRRDFLHKLTTELVKQHDLICIEDLCVTGLARTKLSKRIGDAALYEFRRQLAYKAEAAGVQLAVVDRFYPSSKRCFQCGRVNADLAVGDRRWTCDCGASLDRDLNAAMNLLAEGRRHLETVAAGHADTTETPVEPASDFRWKRRAAKQEPRRGCQE